MPVDQRAVDDLHVIKGTAASDHHVFAAGRNQGQAGRMWSLASSGAGKKGGLEKHELAAGILGVINGYLGDRGLSLRLLRAGRAGPIPLYRGATLLRPASKMLSDFRRKGGDAEEIEMSYVRKNQVRANLPNSFYLKARADPELEKLSVTPSELMRQAVQYVAECGQLPFKSVRVTEDDEALLAMVRKCISSPQRVRVITG